MAYGAILGKEGGGGKRSVRFVVATSTAGYTAADCDYLCDGTNDQEEINAAISALPSNGGEVLLLDGTYNVTSSINLNIPNAKLSGNGNSSKIVASADAIVVNAEYCEVSSLNIECNDSTSQSGITINKISSPPATYIVIANNYIYGAQYGITNNGSDRVLITNNKCDSNRYGIRLSNNSNDNIITDNFCRNSILDGIYTSSFRGLIANNIVQICGTEGIALVACDNNIVTGNYITTCDKGIYLDSHTSNNNISNNYISLNESDQIYLGGDYNAIIGNSCYQSSDYLSSQNSIIASNGANNNLIVGNSIFGKNYVDNGSGNTWANNKY